MATGSKIPKSKPFLNFGGFDYVSQGQRKDGSTTWRCFDRDCEGRLLKKGDEDVEVLKEHSTELPSIKAAVIHLGMNCIKEQAVNNPHESTKEIIKQGMLKANELMIALMPSPSVVEESINNWKHPKEPSKDKERTPKPKDRPQGGPSRKSSVKLPRKRMKLSSAEDLASDEEESPRGRKRSRSKSIPDMLESDDE
ncbi:unnamed protein product [Allacma fusca]|uniref:FLYWCH-type domain-containing protein n=1 Tax=Allacma fusca TaxID=39272 RepID=A0A8J2KFH1_9HEXA|nr:unnamed protein product [Allacma fusca]